MRSRSRKLKPKTGRARTVVHFFAVCRCESWWLMRDQRADWGNLTYRQDQIHSHLLPTNHSPVRHDVTIIDERWADPKS